MCADLIEYDSGEAMNVTIVIPVYNVAPYIGDCLRSVMRQTYQGTMECLLIDDCGTDESISIAERMIAEYNDNHNENENANHNLDDGGRITFKIVHHEVNRGLSAARNTGTEHATGDYIYYLDSDDVITEDCIETLMRIVTEHPDVEMVQGNARRHYPQKEPIVLVKKITVPFAETNDEVRRCYYQLGQFYVNVWNKLLRRDFVIRHNILCQEGLLFEDNLWIFYLLKYLSKAAFVLDITYHQKKRLNSITTSASERTQGYYYSIIYREVLEHLTPGHERQEYAYYAMAAGMAYLDYVHDVPEFEDVLRMFRKSKRYGSRTIRIKLDFYYLIGSFKYGWVVYSLLIRLKHPRLLISDIRHIWDYGSED